MMDSASSGSLQSSCGGAGGGDNDEYESNGGELMSSFLKKHELSSPTPQQQSISPQHPPPPNFFDLSDFLDANFQQNANCHLNFGNNLSPSSLASCTSQALTLGSQINSGNKNNINQASSSSIHFQSAVEESNTNRSGYKRSDDQKNIIIGIKNNSKKRSRASRRAPTTVLKTDAINFRQMVQEFTGIPAPPLFDLFSRSGGSSMRISHNFNALGSCHPLRPFAQKGSSSTSTSLLNSRMVNNRNDLEVVPTDNGLPPNLKLPHQTENAFNIQNQFTFQPLQESTHSPVFNDISHGSSSMAAPPADLDELAGIHNHHR